MNVQFALQVIVAALATVGIEEFIKNFMKNVKTIWYAVLMLPLSIGCFCAVNLLPTYVIGSLLTIGSVQLCYQTLIQGFKSVVTKITDKIESSTGSAKNVPATSETPATPGK
jgi:hypothetical protein